MYPSARWSAPSRAPATSVADGATCAGVVPQVTGGANAPASKTTRESKAAPGSVRSSRHSFERGVEVALRRRRGP